MVQKFKDFISSQTEILFYEEIMSLKSSRNLFIELRRRCRKAVVNISNPYGNTKKMHFTFFVMFIKQSLIKPVLHMLCFYLYLIVEI